MVFPLHVLDTLWLCLGCGPGMHSFLGGVGPSPSNCESCLWCGPCTLVPVHHDEPDCQLLFIALHLNFIITHHLQLRVTATGLEEGGHHPQQAKGPPPTTLFFSLSHTHNNMFSINSSCYRHCHHLKPTLHLKNGGWCGSCNWLCPINIYHG